MVIIALIIATLGLFWAVVLLNGHQLRRWLIGGFLILFLGMIGLLIANDNFQYGMVKTHQRTTSTLVSSIPNQPASVPNVLLYQPLGNGTEKVYLYRTNTSQAKPQAVPTKHVSSKLKMATSDQATLTVTTSRWQYRNDWQHALFAFSGEQNRVAHRDYTFRLPQTWLSLSTTEAKQLAKIMKSPVRQQAIKTKVTEQVAKAVKQDPKMSASQRSALIQKTTIVVLKAQLK